MCCSYFNGFNALNFFFFFFLNTDSECHGPGTAYPSQQTLFNLLCYKIQQLKNNTTKENYESSN
jgi:hypothetical protein